MIEFLVVGSGPAGVHAAQALVERGARVTMLDAGIREPESLASRIPDTDFTSLRRNDSEQHEYFLGPDFEGVPLRGVKAGAGLSAPRQYVLSRVAELIPSMSQGFAPIESLALGGLGQAWGLGCFVMSDAELTAMGIKAEGLARCYQDVCDRIGISGAETEETEPFRHGLTNLQPELELDESSELLRERARRRARRLHDNRLHLAAPLVALLSRDFDGRRGCRYQDMEFWSDHGRSAYRPSYTVEKLRSSSNFEYRGNALVTRYRQSRDGGVEVEYLDLRDGLLKTEVARKVLLAAGALGSARIYLRSLPDERREHESLPLLNNPYRYILCIRPELIGRPLRDRRHSIVQLMLTYDEQGDGSHVPTASILTYRSLLLFRLIQETPLPLRQARSLIQTLVPAFNIVGVFHPDHGGDGERTLRLVKDDRSPTGDRMQIRYSLTAEEEDRVDRNQAAIARGLRMVGAYPIRSVPLEHGASIHYGGTLAERIDRSNGRLMGESDVYVADGSAFAMVPAKGITLTLMAYGRWVAERASSA
jgi:choline dehydrogenase-like flavoprotein